MREKSGIRRFSVKSFLTGRGLWLVLAMGLLLIVVWVLRRPMVASTSAQSVLVWRGWRAEALWHQPFFIARKILAQDGIELVLHKRSKQSIELADNQAVILGGRYVLDEEEKARLYAWVNKGGRVILMGQQSWAEEFGANWQPMSAELADCASVKGASNQEEGLTAVAQSGVLYGKFKAAGVELSPQFNLAVSNVGVWRLGKEWQVLGEFCDKPYVFAAKKQLGAGQVWVLAHDVQVWQDSMTNPPYFLDQIGDAVPIAAGDNAAYWHALMQENQRVVLARESRLNKSNVLSYRLPAAHWWAVMLTAGLWIMAICWRANRRFGALVCRQEEDNQDFVKHLYAAGRFWQHHLGAGELVAYAQKRVERLWAARCLSCGGEQRVLRQVAQQLGWEEEKVQRVRRAEGDADREFVRIMQELERLRSVL